MSDVRTGAEALQPSEVGTDRRKGWLAGGGVIGGILASACCVVPLVLVTLGISGAWIGSLTSLEPYKPYVAAVTAVFIGLGFWQVYFKPKPTCAEGTYCARPVSSRITQGALWFATVLIVLAMTIGWGAPFLY